MGGGKETPRQKMIGLMYLVLMALLAMNVSKSVLNAFIIIDESLEKTNENFSLKNQYTYDKFDKAAMADPRAEKWKIKAHKVQKEANVLYQYIKEIKHETIAAVDGITVAEVEAFHTPIEGEQLGWWRIQQKDNYDIPTHFLIGNEDNPRTDAYSAIELREKIRTYQEHLCEILENDTSGMHLGTHNLDAKIMNDAEVNEDWSMRNFDHLPLVAVITNMTTFQSNVRNMEADVIKKLYSHIGSADFKFDELGVKIIASNQVMVGDSFKAEVVIAAYSTAINPRLEVGSDFDSSGNVLSDIDTAGIVVKNGIAHYYQVPRSEGPVVWGGRLGVLKPGAEKEESAKFIDSDYSWYHFAHSYMAAKPTLVVSPTAMNVVYRGLKNPIEVSVPGFTSDKLTVTFSNLKSRSGGKGKFEINPGKGREVIVSVVADLGGGKKQSFPKKTFRVKDVPDPVAKFAGVKGGAVKRNKLSVAPGVRAEMENFQFELSFKVTSFIMSTTIKGKVVELKAKSNRVTGEMKTLLKNAKANQKIYIEKIKAVGPDGRPRDLGTVAIRAI